MKARWVAFEKGSPEKFIKRVEGEFSFDSLVVKKMEQLETLLFQEVAKQAPNATDVGIRTYSDNGSGIIADYRKAGIIWVRTHIERIVPNWFPWAMCAFMIFIIVVFGLVVFFIK